MSSRIETEYKFITSVYYYDELQVHNYTLKCFMLPSGTSSYDISIALQRIQHFIEIILPMCIWVEQSEHQVIQNLNDINIPVITLPEVPEPELINLALYHKITAMVEDKFEIFETAFSCSANNVTFYFSDLDDENVFLHDGWWHDPSPNFNDLKTEGNVIGIHEKLRWNDFGLEWEDQKKPKVHEDYVAEEGEENIVPFPTKKENDKD